MKAWPQSAGAAFGITTSESCKDVIVIFLKSPIWIMRASREGRSHLISTKALSNTMTLCLCAVIVGISLFLSGCVSVIDEFADRGNDPIPAVLVAEMTAKGMSPSDPVLIRKKASWRFGNATGREGSRS